MKTKEELNALREEVAVVKEKLAALTNEELAQVSGGLTPPSGAKPLGLTRQIGNLLFTGHVDKYHGVEGKCYYIVRDDKDEWYYGRLLRSFEVNWIVCTVRHHVFRIYEHNGAYVGSQEEEFAGGDVTLFNSKYEV